MNFKNIVLFLLTICYHGIWAQIPKAQLTGKVIDSQSQEAVYYATISLIPIADTKKINGTVANEKGNFILEDLDSGVYNITISFMGYEPQKYLNYTLKPGKNNLETIVLKINKEALSEIVIQTDRPVIENKIDRLVYNAERDVTLCWWECNRCFTKSSDAFSRYRWECFITGRSRCTYLN